MNHWRLEAVSPPAPLVSMEEHEGEELECVLQEELFY